MNTGNAKFAKFLLWLQKNPGPKDRETKEEFQEIIHLLENNKLIVAGRKLDKLNFEKIITVHTFSTTKAKFFVQGSNDYKLKISMSSDFEEKILPYIPAILNFTGGKVASFELLEDMWDSAIIDELRSDTVISIKEWAERTVAMILNNSSDLKTSGRSNVQYVKVAENRIARVSFWFTVNGWLYFQCSRLDEKHCPRHAGSLILDSVIPGE